MSTGPLTNLSPEQKRQLLAELLKKRAADSSPWQPLSQGQRSMWFMHHLIPDRSLFNVTFALRIRASLDLTALRLALQALVDRHPVLRTTYAMHDGEPLQRIHDHQELPWEEVDASQSSDGGIDEQAALHDPEPIDLQNGPVLRAKILKVARDDQLLVITIHHIACDLWSVDILVDELRELYVAKVNGTPAALTDLSADYRSYVRWQDKMIAGAEGQQHWEYWKSQLAGELAVLDLPTDRYRPGVQTYSNASRAFEFDPELTRQLREFSKSEQTTLFTTVLAAYQVLLARYCNQDEILVGSPSVGRSRSEFERVVGFFANPVAVRASVKHNPPFREFLKQVRDDTLDAMDHQDFPFPLLVERLEGVRDPSRPPLCQAFFIWDRPKPKSRPSGICSGDALNKILLDWGECDVQSVTPVPTGPAVDIALLVLEVGDHLSASLSYNTDLWDEAMIVQFQGHFANLLQSIVDCPDMPVRDLQILSDSEVERLISSGLPTESESAAQPSDDESSQTTVTDLFERQVEWSPNAVAVQFQQQTLTYAQLNQRANQWARRLQAADVGPGTLVGLCADRSANMVVALLGILKAGACYLPLDPGYPTDRLGFMIRDAGVSCLITESHLVSRLPTVDSVLILDEPLVEPTAFDHQLPPVRRTDPSDLAYLIYTSGSAGKPKGVEIPHSALLNFLESMSVEPGLSSEDCLLAVTTISFDISNLEIYLPLVTGARLIVAAREETRSGDRLLELIKRHRVTVMQATPASWRLLLQAGWRDGSGLKALCGGEALPRELADQILGTGAELWNMYGPTETTIWSTVCKVETAGKPISIGRPINHTEVFVLDDRRRPVPTGVAGELHIGGRGLARGYLNRPELTAEKFIPHPFRDRGRLYRTGDQARFRRDGTIECLGRLDRQVKLRGFRIELGEIESVLATHPSVVQAAAVVRDESWRQQLVAYYVCDEDRPPTPIELREFLENQLPDYMVPTAFIKLSTLPLTANGKVAYEQLPDPDGERPLSESSYVSPQNEMEQEIADVWQEVLQLDKVGIHDNFFDLGGHSVLAVQAQFRLENLLNRSISLVDFFRSPTIRGLAEQFQAADSPSRAIQVVQDRMARHKAALHQTRSR